MPIYEYVCLKCERGFEELVRNQADEDDLKCPACGSKKLTKQMSAFGVQGSVDKAITAGSSSCSSCSATTCSTCR